MSFSTSLSVGLGYYLRTDPRIGGLGLGLGDPSPSPNPCVTLPDAHQHMYVLQSTGIDMSFSSYNIDRSPEFFFSAVPVDRGRRTLIYISKSLLLLSNFSWK